MLIKIIKQSYAALANKKSTKLALIVRADIKMSKGKTAAQCAHAAILCYQSALLSKNEQKRRALDAWCATDQPKIVLRVEKYDEMLKLHEAAANANLVAEIVRDAGRTQLEPGTATVLGLGPASVEQIDLLVAHLKLL